MTQLEPTVENGYPMGRPPGRPRLVADDIVQAAIEALPMEVRLYPDIYAWRVVDALNGGSWEEGSPALPKEFITEVARDELA